MASSAGQPGFIEGSLTQTNGPFPTGASPNSKLPPLSPTSQPSSPIWEAKDEMHYVREALKTARDKRSESQLACVRDWLEQVKFQHVKMDDMRSVLPQLARQMEFSKPPGLEPLFKQGDPGDHLYLVLDRLTAHRASTVAVLSRGRAFAAAAGVREESGWRGARTAAALADGRRPRGGRRRTGRRRR